jgi:hypothetical protein
MFLSLFVDTQSHQRTSSLPQRELVFADNSKENGRCGLQLELPVRSGNSIRLFKVYRHATARSHQADEAKPAIYGPCGVMACTLGIFLSKSIYLKVAVRICAEPFFFFFAAVYACDNVSSRGRRVVCFHSGCHASSNS